MKTLFFFPILSSVSALMPAASYDSSIYIRDMQHNLRARHFQPHQSHLYRRSGRKSSSGSPPAASSPKSGGTPGGSQQRRHESPPKGMAPPSRTGSASSLARSSSMDSIRDTVSSLRPGMQHSESSGSFHAQPLPNRKEIEQGRSSLAMATYPMPVPFSIPGSPGRGSSVGSLAKQMSSLKIGSPGGSEAGDSPRSQSGSPSRSPGRTPRDSLHGSPPRTEHGSSPGSPQQSQGRSPLNSPRSGAPSSSGSNDNA